MENISNNAALTNNSFLTFKIKEEKFAVNVEFVSDILEVPSMVKLPGSPEYLRGIMRFAKIAVPVVDLRLVMHYPKAGINVNSIIILFRTIFESKIYLIGALVDSIDEFIELDINQLVKKNPVQVELVSEYKNLKYKFLNPQNLISPEDYFSINNMISKASLQIK